MADINKVVITEEAEFDYEVILGLPMPKADIKEACENYIESRYDGGRTLWGYYYKWKYYDETADKMLLLFFYKIALDDARRNCPVDTGALKASLKLNEGKATETKATVSVDYDKSLRYGTFVELGARGRPANPFLRNAVDENIDKINDEIVKAISNAVGRKL